MFNPDQVKNDFPIFYHRKGLVYLDSTATSLKPKQVIDKEVEYYKKYSANIHRGIYKLAEKATEEYEETRKIVALFIGADSPKEIIFTRNATESLNLLATSMVPEILKEGDEIATTIMEHHSNFVPWQHIASKLGASLKVIFTDESYQLKLDTHNEKIENYITKKTKILTLTYISNALGTINPIKEIIAAAKKINPDIVTIVDAAQAVPHIALNVQDLGCDFLAFSSHKMLGPTGVGVLWGRKELLEKMSPYQLGGEMIANVTLENTEYAPLPHKFEAGTPNIGGVIALKEAIAYLQYYGLDKIHRHEKSLAAHCIESLQKEFGEEVQVIGPSKNADRAGIVTFTYKNYHPHDIAQILDEESITVRAGHHCTMPLHHYLGLPATTRASFYLYNTEEDVEKLVKGLKKVKKVLG